MMHAALTPLRLARLHAQVPQFVVAKRARMSASRLSVLERGHDEPHRHERAALSRVLGVPEEQLFPIPVTDGFQLPATPTLTTEPACGLTH